MQRKQSKQMEEVLAVHLHKKVVKFHYHTGRGAYFIGINEEPLHRVTEREIDILMKSFEIIKLKMGGPDGKLIFEKSAPPKSKRSQ